MAVLTKTLTLAAVGLGLLASAEPRPARSGRAARVAEPIQMWLEATTPPPSEQDCHAAGPICKGYGSCEPYLFADAKCVCRCMGDDDWSETVRCCLWKMRKEDRDPDLAHAVCWGGAAIDTGSLPAPKLLACVSLCAVK